MFRGEDEDAGEREKGEGVGGCVAPSGASSGEQVSRRWPERACARRAHALLPTGRRLKTVATAVGWPHSAGPAQELGRLWWAAQVSFALFIIYCFLFSVVCFDLV